MHEVLYVKDNIDKMYINERNQEEEKVSELRIATNLQSRTLRRQKTK